MFWDVLRIAHTGEGGVQGVRFRRLEVFALAALVLGASTVHATESAPAEAATQAEAVHRRFLETLNAGDMDSALAMFVDDAFVWQAFGCDPSGWYGYCLGKPTIRRHLEAVVGNHWQFSEVELTTLRTSFTEWTWSRSELRGDDITAAGSERVLAGFAVATRGDRIASIRGAFDTSDEQTRLYRTPPSAQAAPQPAAPPAPPEPAAFGRFVDVGDGRRIYLECMGEGSPAVVFEGGSSATRGAASGGVWSGVRGQVPHITIQQDLANVTRACAYDPASVGLSDPRPRPSTGLADAEDMRLLLHAAGIEPPYVLVGISYGGAVVRLFASTYPADVAGVVFLDASGALGDENERFAALRQPEAATRFWDGVRQNWAQAASPQGLAGGTDLQTTAAQARAAGPLPDVPVVLLSAGLPFGPWHVDPAITVEQREETRYGIQADLARLAPRGTHRIVDTSEHAMNNFVPGLIVEVIQGMVAEARRPATARAE